MKKHLKNGLLAILFGSLTLGASSTYSKTVLKMNSQWPSTTYISKVDQWFADEIKKRTDGDLEIKIFWSEALGKASENLSLMQKGAIEMGNMSPGYYPSQMPFHATPNSIPMAMDSVDQAHTLMNRLVEEVPAFAEEAKANGVRTLFFHHLNPYLLVSKDPMLTLDDLKDKKIRTWGSDMPRMAEAADMTPVTLSMPEIYESLARGVIDAAPFSLDLVVTYKLYEVAKNITNVTLWLGPSSGVWISESAWNKLTPEHQQLLQQVASEANDLDMQETILAADVARKELEKQGVAFHDFPQTDLEKWKSSNPNFFDEFIAEQTKLGKGDNAKKMIAIWEEVMEMSSQ